MPSLSPSPPRFRLARCGALLAALVAAHPAAGQQGLHCGDRPPGDYAVVLDASSSLQGSAQTARRTEESYVDALEAISGVLCQGERMFVYPMVRNESTRLLPVDSVLPSSRGRERLRQVARASLQRDPGHSDFLLVIDRTKSDLLARPGMRAVFFLTDGSFYPAVRPAPDRGVQAVLDRLSELRTVAAELRRQQAPFYVVGIGAGQAYALDPELRPTWPDSARRAWHTDSATLDLKSLRGDGMLRSLFGSQYADADSLDLWKLVIDGDAAAWATQLGYTTGWAWALDTLQGIAMEHLVVRLPSRGEGVTCASLLPARDHAGAPPIEPMQTGAGRRACSLQAPTARERKALADRGVDTFAFRQTPLFYPDRPTASLHGVNELVLSTDPAGCPDWVLSSHVLHGKHWPAGGDEPVSLLEIVRVGEARTHDTVSMYRYQGSPCVVPGLSMDSVSRSAGDYLLFLSDARGQWVQRRTFQDAALKLEKIDFRPGGFPFPPDRLVLLGVCISSAEPVQPGDKLLVELDGKTHRLDTHADAGCARPDQGAHRPHVYGFRGVVLLGSTRLPFGRIGLTRDGRDPGAAEPGRWVPLPLTPDGIWFMSPLCLVLSAIAGFLIQYFYLRYKKEPVRLREVRLRRKISLLVSMLMSALLVVVAVECIIMVTATPIDTAAIPIPFALVVLAHGLKLFAAALVPEVVEDTLLND